MPFWSILSKAFGLLPVLTSGSNKRTEKQDRVDPGKDFKPFLKPAEYTSSDFQTSFPQFFSTLDSAPYTPNHPTQSQCRSWWRRRSLRSSGWWSRCRGWSSTSGTHLGKSFSSPFFWRTWTFGRLWELDSTSRPPGRAPDIWRSSTDLEIHHDQPIPPGSEDDLFMASNASVQEEKISWQNADHVQHKSESSENKCP